MNGEKKSTVLITGGSGLTGKYLSSLLLERGYNVAHLSRKQDQFGIIRVHRWDPEKEILDPVVLEGIDYIIHLAGANLGEKRWTPERKQEIITSRTAGAELLYRTVKENNIPLKGFISSSAVGYYGTRTSEKIYTEDDPPGTDFLATVCKKWEDSAIQFESAGIRTVRIRSAFVLARENPGILKMLTPAKYGFLAKTGSGRQYFPWIHISDLCNIYIKAIEDEKMNGPYNAVSPYHVTHRDFMEDLAHAVGRPLLTVPSFVLQAATGEMSDLILKGSRVSSQKVTDAGYKFSWISLHYALHDILSD